MSRGLARITDNYCASWYISGLGTRQSSDREAITIPCTRYAPVIVLHKAREALQQLYSWWIVLVYEVVLQNVPDLLTGSLLGQKIIRKFYRVRDLPRHHFNGMPQTFVGCLARYHSLKIAQKQKAAHQELLFAPKSKGRPIYIYIKRRLNAALYLYILAKIMLIFYILLYLCQ